MLDSQQLVTELCEICGLLADIIRRQQESLEQMDAVIEEDLLAEIRRKTATFSCDTDTDTETER